jgi:cell division septation protein DedD
MSTAFEEEEDRAPRRRRRARAAENDRGGDTDFDPELGLDMGSGIDPERGPDRELTISATTLLAIFFGLVLLCGLFFGLGYTLGRRSPADASAAPAAGTLDAADSGISRPKPSATVTDKPPVTPAPNETPASDSSLTTQDDASKIPAAETPAVSTPAAQPAPVASQAVQAASRPASVPTEAPATTSLMVQIAAISDQNDATVLVSALQKRGYAVSVRREPGDTLMHVQVGPFATRADALAMRQKLLNDGYNAIVK